MLFRSAGLEDDPFQFKSIIDIDFQTVSTNQATQLIQLINYGFKYDFTKENEIVSKLTGVKDAFPLLKYITVTNESLPYIKDYIKAMNK